MTEGRDREVRIDLDSVFYTLLTVKEQRDGSYP